MEGQRRAAGPEAFAAASQFVTPADVAEKIPCGDDVEVIAQAVAEFADAGFTDVALLQIGADRQDDFLDAARSSILPALRAQIGGP